MTSLSLFFFFFPSLMALFVFVLCTFFAHFTFWLIYLCSFVYSVGVFVWILLCLRDYVFLLMLFPPIGIHLFLSIMFSRSSYLLPLSLFFSHFA